MTGITAYTEIYLAGGFADVALDTSPTASPSPNIRTADLPTG
jgi:hypothetical protein